MNKRAGAESNESHSHKKRKHHREHDRANGEEQHKHHKSHDHRGQQSSVSHEDAVRRLPPQTSQSGPVPAYVPFTVSTTLPPLPEVKQGSLSTAPFKHRSAGQYNRSVSGSSSTDDLTYERLEFLGDAYIEIIATRLIFERYYHLPAGQQSQLRELLVKNETLSEYSRAYGFDTRVNADNIRRMVEDSKHKGNKGFNKVLGDVFEAYVAAVILSDVEDGFAVAEKWLTTLWAPKLVEVSQSDASLAAAKKLTDQQSADPRKVYNPSAKVDLQKRLFKDSSTRLEYERYKDSVELKGDQLGQNRHFIALYFTGYGHERKVLGKGEGKNKVEAGNWAAIDAMHGEAKGIVEECERQLKEIKAQRSAAGKPKGESAG